MSDNATVEASSGGFLHSRCRHDGDSDSSRLDGLSARRTVNLPYSDICSSELLALAEKTLAPGLLSR